MECIIDTPLGPMLFDERDGAVSVLRFAAAGDDLLLPPPETVLAKRTAAWLQAYFAGKNPAVDLPLAPKGTAFQHRVWQACREVPYGDPVWLLIPCHRIVGSGGDLTGYAGGLEKKAALLRLEKNG